MKFFSVHNLLLLVAFVGVASATPTPEVAARQAESVTWIASWSEAGLRRYRFYTNVQDMNRFVHAFQQCRGITSNWQAWQQDGHGVFDDSEVEGIAGARVISCGIAAVTGQSVSVFGVSVG